MLVSVRSLLAAVSLTFLAADVAAQGLPEQTWPIGTRISTWDHGGRITTFHRGYLYMGGDANDTVTTGTWTYNISNAAAPQLVRTYNGAVNGHTWAKVGDVFWRQYWIPEIGDDDPRPFQNLSNMLAPTQQISNLGSFQANPSMGWPGNWLDTYPYHFGNGIFDARVGWWPPVAEGINVRTLANMTNGANQFRIGNLLFLTPSDTQDGVAVFDISHPSNPQLLDRLIGNYKQYTTAWQVWRHHLVLMFGDDTNGPPGQTGNALVIDFSDPGDLQLVHTIPHIDLPGRYAHFQDQYAFSGRYDRGVKYNMETHQVEQEFLTGDWGAGDFQWIPLGHLLLSSTSEATAGANGTSRSYLFSQLHNVRDTTRPTVGYHLPRPNATHQSLHTVVGLVINETLDSPTVTSQNIVLRPVGGAPVPTVVIHTSYNVVNIVPDALLQPDTTYEVTLVQDGVRDVAGNGFARYSFLFSTGAVIDGGPVIFENGFEP